jgi:UDP-2-acetamido-2,6-beta-L-arabino-hexul-4-ose reductase
MRILITGSNGFIGKNLVSHLNRKEGVDIFHFNRGDCFDSLNFSLEEIDLIFHLAGENRPNSFDDFNTNNAILTKKLCDELQKKQKHIPIIFSSTNHVLSLEEKSISEIVRAYGISKLSAESALMEYAQNTGASVIIYRFPGVFGKWCKPNYNSVVATFCHNIARQTAIEITDPNKVIKLVYVDDVISDFLVFLESIPTGISFKTIHPEHKISLGDLANTITNFKKSRKELHIDAVGVGFIRALYATYISYLPKEEFSYDLECFEDKRGVFVEILKTQNSGQISYFTAKPGVSRGGHFHHSKIEKFLVIQGEALFRFRHIISNDYFEIKVKADQPMIVETIPGWTHDITNIGCNELISLLWANEVFNLDRPDTIFERVVN